MLAVAVADDVLPLEASPFGVIIELPQWDEIVELRRRHLAAYLDETLSGRDRISHEVRTGEPATELYDAATGADLLVVGSRRWGSFERVMVGSTAEELCAGAPCSVLVVPRPAEPAGRTRADRAARTPAHR